jgi:hypothetical protein
MWKRFSLGTRIFIILAGIGSLFILTSLILLVIAINTMRAQQSYQAGLCTITAKHLLHEIDTSSYTGTGYHNHTTTDLYAPSFDYIVKTADGKSYAAQGYDGLNIYTSDLTGQQAIMDRYNIGQTYQCWYDPLHPAQAILVRSFNWLLFLIAGVFLLVGVVLAIIGLLLFRSFRRRWGNPQMLS